VVETRFEDLGADRVRELRSWRSVPELGAVREYSTQVGSCRYFKLWIGASDCAEMTPLPSTGSTVFCCGGSQFGEQSCLCRPLGIDLLIMGPANSSLCVMDPEGTLYRYAGAIPRIEKQDRPQGRRARATL
jgi:hypothetical protein